MDYNNPNDCPYYLISRTALAVTSALKRGFAEADVENVKPAYLGVLMTLWQEDGIKVIELGRKAGLEPSTMTGLIDRMERDNLVVRSADHDDRRVLKIFLTDNGRNARKSVLEVVDKTLKKVFSGIPERDLTLTKDLLRQVLLNAHEGS